MSDATTGHKSKSVATWLAVIGGTIGLHRFYLHGFRDRWGWAMPLPTLIGVLGIMRMKQFGGDDHAAWVLIPFLGLTVSIAMISAIVCGLTPDERWNARFNPRGSDEHMGWPTIIGVVVALVLGAGVLMATLAFSAQRYFEYEAEPARTAQGSSARPIQ